jgi:RNA polymerase sigma factor (sigma-70 family)
MYMSMSRQSCLKAEFLPSQGAVPMTAPAFSRSTSYPARRWTLVGEYNDEESSPRNRQPALKSPEKLSRFEEQISPHLKSAYNLARWLTRSHEDAEDVVQEAFLRAFSAFDGYRGDDANAQSAKAWLLTIVRNTSMTWLKRNRSAGATVELEETLEEPREPSADPEELLLISCDREQVRQALEQLPLEFREAIILREMEGLSYKEISATLSVPLGTVMSRLSRGRDWLKRLLSSARPVQPEGGGIR